MEEKGYEQLAWERTRALANGGAVEFVRYSNALGIDCADEHEQMLHEKGLAEILSEEIKYANPRKTAEKNAREQNPYKLFLRGAAEKNINVFDLQSKWEDKMELLEEYFPRFNRHGKQPIENYRPAQIGALFKKIYNCAIRITAQ